ncbi:hypothetical protein AtEden1_Chr1g0041521 [Arabidopsis thaliana]
MDFGYTMKALRSKKKCFLVRRHKAKDSYGLWLHHESFEKQEEELKPQPHLISLSSVSLLEDTKPKTHMDFGYTMKALRSKKKVELKPQPDLKGVRIVSLLKDTKPKTHMDFGYTMKALRSKKKVELKPQPDLKGVRIVSLLKDTKPKTHMDFGYTMKALRSKKKVAKDSYGLWLHHESFEKQEEELKPQPDLKGVRIVSLLKDTKPKTHMDFGYTMKALRSKKKVG